jgi:hypothetical protein
VSESDGAHYLADLRQTVRDQFANGALFVLAHDKTCTGRGNSDICAVCGEPIFAAESAQEVIAVRHAHAHLLATELGWLVNSDPKVG